MPRLRQWGKTIATHSPLRTEAPGTEAPWVLPVPHPLRSHGTSHPRQHNSRNEEKKNSLPCSPTIFKWFDFTLPILPRVVPNKRCFKAVASKHGSPLKRDCVNGDTAALFLHGAAPCACLETDCSLSWLKISCIVFSCLGSYIAVA